MSSNCAICFLHFTNKDGCVASDSILIKVLNQQQVYIPNAFSPNDDKNNDEYRPYCAETVAGVYVYAVRV